MEKFYEIAEKSYYIYNNLPKFIKIIIKIIYSILLVIYKIFRSIYRLIKRIFRKPSKGNTNKVNYISSNSTGPIIKNDYYVKKKITNNFKISWIIPLPQKGSAGHRNFFRIIGYLGKKGYDVTVYIDNKRSTSPDPVYSGVEAQEFIKNNYFDLQANIIYGTENIEKCDALVATHFESAYIVKANEKKAKKLFYFIQDYESYFTPMGDDFIRAHQSYKLGLYPITSGPWPLNFLKKDFGVKEGYSFYFPLDRSIYNYNGQKKDDMSIVFFAKPGMPRRCYRLGVDALKIVKDELPDVTIHFYGENSVSYRNVPFDFVDHGLLPNIRLLGDLYRKMEIGLAFSTTNPSLVPYEMSCCGVAVVDLDYNDNIINYGNDYNNITLAEPFAEEIAKKIISLLKNKELREAKVKNAIKYCDIFPSEEQMCSGIEKEILKVCGENAKNK